MERLNENKIICHIIGLNPEDKSRLEELCRSIKKYNLIDLDKINNEILNDEEMNKMFKTYTRLKKNKNDKFKDIDKRFYSASPFDTETLHDLSITTFVDDIWKMHVGHNHDAASLANMLRQANSRLDGARALGAFAQKLKSRK